MNRPVNDKCVITQGFGVINSDYANVPGWNGCHLGIDYAPLSQYLNEEIRVKPIQGGVVLSCGTTFNFNGIDYTGFGNVMMIDHGNNQYSIYAHSERFLKKVGDYVTINDEITVMGYTGYSVYVDGNGNTHVGDPRSKHLHLSAMKDGKFIDPNFISENDEILTIINMPQSKEQFIEELKTIFVKRDARFKFDRTNGNPVIVNDKKKTFYIVGKNVIKIMGDRIAGDLRMIGDLFCSGDFTDAQRKYKEVSNRSDAL